jgi:hypothetical protein
MQSGCIESGELNVILKSPVFGKLAYHGPAIFILAPAGPLPLD